MARRSLKAIAAIAAKGDTRRLVVVLENEIKGTNAVYSPKSSTGGQQQTATAAAVSMPLHYVSLYNKQEQTLDDNKSDDDES